MRSGKGYLNIDLKDTMSLKLLMQILYSTQFKNFGEYERNMDYGSYVPTTFNLIKDVNFMSRILIQKKKKKFTKTPLTTQSC